MIPAPCTNRLIRGGWCVGSQPAILVGAWIARSVAEWSVRTARIDRQSCMRSSHAPRTRNPEPLVAAYAKTVKLNPVKPTQERCVEKPRAAAGDADRSSRACMRSWHGRACVRLYSDCIVPYLTLAKSTRLPILLCKYFNLAGAPKRTVG